MSIKVACSCGKKLSVKNAYAALTVKCPACQSRLRVPLTQDEFDAVAVPHESGIEDPDDNASVDQGNSLLASIEAARNTEFLTRVSAPPSSEVNLASVRASMARAGVSCYFFGFLLTFFAACYLVVAPTLHQGDFLALGRVIRGMNYANLLAEVSTLMGFVLCLTAPQTVPRRGALIVGVISGLLGVLIAGSVVWSPLLALRVGRWLPQIAMVATHLSFLLFLSGLGEFIHHQDLTRQATRVLVFYGIFFAVSLLAFGGRPPMPNMIGRGAMGGLVGMAALMLVWMVSGILGFFGLLRLLSNCRSVLNAEGTV